MLFAVLLQQQGGTNPSTLPLYSGEYPLLWGRNCSPRPERLG